MIGKDQWCGLVTTMHSSCLWCTFCFVADEVKCIQTPLNCLVWLIIEVFKCCCSKVMIIVVANWLLNHYTNKLWDKVPQNELTVHSHNQLTFLPTYPVQCFLFHFSLQLSWLHVGPSFTNNCHMRHILCQSAQLQGT